MLRWESRLLTFIDSCSTNGFDTASDAILAMAEILDDAPDAIVPLISPRAGHGRLARLIAVEADVCAAMELVGPLCGMLISRSAEGSSSGLVKIVEEVEEGNFFAADPAIALLGAYGNALVGLVAHAKSNGGFEA